MHLYNLCELDLSYNHLTGPLPQDIDDPVALCEINFSHNVLTGSIPIEFKSLLRLRKLNLSHNALAGEIPPEITALVKLSVLKLSYNKLEGSLPLEIGDLTNLKHLILSNNTLFGSLPKSMSRLKINRLRLNENRFSGKLENLPQPLIYKKNPPSFDISGTYFSDDTYSEKGCIINEGRRFSAKSARN